MNSPANPDTGYSIILITDGYPKLTMVAIGKNCGILFRGIEKRM